MRQATLFFLFCLPIFVFGQQRNEEIIIREPSVPFYMDKEKAKIDHITYLLSAKMGNNRSVFNITLPIYGEMRVFQAIPNEVIDDESRRLYPDLLTFDLKSGSGDGVYGAVTLSSAGLYATVFNMGKMVSIYPDNPGNPDFHVIEYGIQPDIRALKQFCGHDHSMDEVIKKPSLFNKGSRSKITMGSKRHVYDLAIVTTGEFYVENGGTDALVRTVVVNSVNAISAIFNNELSYRLSLGTRIFYYRDPDTDIFIPDNLGGAGRTIQAGNAVAMHFQTNQYDVGHVFHRHQSGDGWSGGGVAQLRSVCNNNGSPAAKGRGWSGSFSNVGNGWISLATHEFAHQFGATHTFNGDGGSCTDNIEDTNSYEIGSGTTIMSYNGICDAPQNIPSGDALDNYFHIKSLEEMYDFVYNGNGASCINGTNSPNMPVTIQNVCAASYTIPKNTPFFLNTFITQPANEQENITFCWEQIDEDGPGIPTIGKIGAAAASDSRAPLFRSYPPSTESGRYFPALGILASGTPSPFEALSTVARTMNFNISVRDNNSSGGTVANNDMSVTVSNAGPFIVTSPVAGNILQAGQSNTITWNTNGSNALCNNLRLRVSLDGGLTYPIVLAENIPYAAGTYNLNINNNFVNTTTAKIMLECSDNSCYSFFNVSSGNFTISSSCTAENSVICPTTSVSLDEGDPGLNLTSAKYIGNNAISISRQIVSSTSFGSVGVRGVNGVGCAREDVRISRVRIYATETGSYTFSFDGEGWASLHRANFNLNNPCASFITSTATRAASGGLFTGGGFTANLTQCTEYEVVFFSYLQLLPATLTLSQVSGPGLIVENNPNPAPNYQSVYVLVNNNTGLIAYAGQSTDFSNTSAGIFTLYSLVLEAGVEEATLIGQNYATVKNTLCVNESYNSRNIEIKPACRITDITAGAQTPCIAASNSFTQQLVVTYDKAPSTGNLSVNGQQFAITGSPQTVTLVNLDSDGQTRDVISFFTESTDCRFEKSTVFTAPVNCCPLTFDLGPDQNKCVGESVLLNAGDNGITYIWRKDGIDQPGTTSKTFPVNASGTYEVEVTHSSGCKKTDRITITFNPLPTVLLTDNQQFCAGETYDLVATTNGAMTFEWYKDNILIPAQNTNTLQINTSGLYRLVAISAFGCRGLDETFVITVAAPVVELGSNLMKCEGEEAILDAGPDGNKYQWFKDGNEISGADKQTYEATQTGTYRVVVTNAALCMTDDEVRVDFFQSPVVNDFPTLINICQGAPSTITGVASDFQTLQWYFDNNPITGATSISVNVDKSGLYTLEAINLANCKTRKSVQVEIRALPALNLGEPTLVSCIGNPVNLDAGPDGTTYRWSRDGITLAQTTRILSVSMAGLYSVTVTNQFNCVNTDQITLSFIPGPTVTLNGDATICEGQSHVITMTTNAVNPEIKWFDANGQINGETQSSLSVTVAGTYRVNVRGGTPACDVTQSVNITVNPRPALNLGNNRTLCEGDNPPILNAGTGNTSFVWTLDGAPLATTPTVTADKSGLYVVTVKNAFNCERTEQVRVTFNPKPTLQMVEDSYDLCAGKTLTINVVSDGTQFEWKMGGTVIAGQSAKTLVIDAAGMYSLNITNAASCKNEKTFSVVSRANPIVDLGANFDLCPGENKTLIAGTHTSYLWSDNSTAPTLQVSAGQPASVTTNKYNVQVTNQFGCTAKDSVTATLFPVVKANIIADKPGVCNGEPVKLTATGGLIYKWTDPAGNTLSSINQAETTASPTETTTYTVEVTDGVCPNNKDTKSIEIEVFEPNEISAGKDTCVVIGKSIRLGASGGVSYQWDNVNLITGQSNIPNPQVSPIVETIFSVTITDANGCEFTDEVVVCVKEDNFKPVSIITPNGDGNNDELFFGGLTEFPDNTLRVFNRWGNLIFEANGYQINGPLFDGTRNGERLPADTYYYILTFDNQVIKSALTILWD